MNSFIKSWKHLNLTFLLSGVILAVFLYKFEPLHTFLLNLGSLGLVGAFIAGMLYVFTFTAATSVVSLLIFAQNHQLFQVALIAGIGAMVGDYLIFKFVKTSLTNEFRPLVETLENEIGRKRISSLKHIIHTKYFNWMLPVVAIILIGLPFFDEVAWGLLGFTRIKTYKLLMMSFLINFIGILLILSASAVITP